jgi:hypothetical protein
MMEVVQTSETLSNLYQSTRRYNPEGNILSLSERFLSVTGQVLKEKWPFPHQEIKKTGFQKPKRRWRSEVHNSEDFSEICGIQKE